MIGLPTQLMLFYIKVLGFPNQQSTSSLKKILTMRFYLCTGFGKLKTSYGGTHEERLAGYGQGNAAASPGFTAMISLII
jgi:hypothetical protein